MEKNELIGKLSNFIRKEKFQEINEIIKKFKNEKNRSINGIDACRNSFLRQEK